MSLLWLVTAFSFGLPALALVGGLLGVSLLMVLAGRRASPTRVILAGVAIATMSSAAMGLLLYLAPNPFAFQEWAFWHMGSLANKSWHSVMLALPGIVLAFPIVWLGRRFLYALTLSEETVATMGFDVARYPQLDVVSCGATDDRIGRSRWCDWICWFISTSCSTIVRI